MSELINYPINRPIILDNLTCIYCGQPFGPEREATKEHVIGRRFVPKGCFDGQWNLIAKACSPCNTEKAALEDDISVITMLPTLLGEYATDDPRLASEVARKALKSGSRRTGKAVAHSHEKITLKGDFLGGAQVTFGLTAPPQIDQRRIFQLAYLHWVGFFYLITYDEQTKMGGFVQTEFAPVIASNKSDWGNARMRWFMDLHRDWDPRLQAFGADGFFKMTIRRAPDKSEVWAWALEWNQNLRIVGFAGRPTEVDAMLAKAPALPSQLMHASPEQTLRYRREVRLSEEDDTLFELSPLLNIPEA